MITPEDRARVRESVKQELEAQRAREAAQAIRFAKVNAFLATLAPMVAGRARKSLERTMRWRTVYATRFEMIERLIIEGATVEGEKLQRNDGSFYDREALTSFGLAYARYLKADDPFH